MNSRPTDEYGFPIPQGFDEQPLPRREPLWRRSPRFRLVVGFILTIAAIAILFGPQIAFFGRRAMAVRLSERAEEKFDLEQDTTGALSDIDEAIAWLPDDPELILKRGSYRLQNKDLEGSLKDCNRVIELAPSYSPAYVWRSMVYQRMRRHREAIADATKAMSLRPDGDHQALNLRAYTRAIAGMELDEGLSDVEQAIDLVGSENIDSRTMASSPDIGRYLTMASYLDTRGYLLHLQGKDDKALADMDKALALAYQYRLQLGKLGAEVEARRLAAEIRRSDRDLAVMYHHRGLIHQKLGNAKQAKADLAQGDKLGYNPNEGVF